ncbi:uncharacterized protein LOC105167794 [Sesamum indicum]|uniref:Uncharacterized protein LOC105167794 n=1 Tax=Sesamum indicum TaxID=4182 RepID=A0A6I9TJF7_SESIN|nr:uncharacterized protein LOC105167794 [Sesamum indicum]
MAEDQYQKDVLYIHPSNNSSFIPTSTTLIGSNYLTWSRAVYVALGCKMKLAFIDGSFPRPPVGSALFEQWRRADLMVTSWLWNSISKEIVEAFMYLLNDKKRQHGGQYNFSGNLEAKAVNKVENTASNSESKTDMADLVTGLLKMVKQKKNIFDPISHFVNFVHFEDQFVGNTLKPSALNFGNWIIQSGAINHVCASLSCFESYSTPSCAHFVHLPDGTKKDQETGEVVARGVLMNKLYILKSTASISLLSAAVSTPHSCGAMIDCNEFVWHKRMGHTFMSAIKHIPECKISNDFVDMQCDICPKAKQSRISFKPSLSQSLVPFELVQLDLWGPYRTPSISGYSYVLTILDDFSKSLWEFLIKHKDQVPATHCFLSHD